MNLPNPKLSQGALVVGAGFAVGYLINQGIDHSRVMSNKDKRKLGLGLILLAASSIVYHVSQGTRWDFSTF